MGNMGSSSNRNMTDFLVTEHKVSFGAFRAFDPQKWGFVRQKHEVYENVRKWALEMILGSLKSIKISSSKSDEFDFKNFSSWKKLEPHNIALKT